METSFFNVKVPLKHGESLVYNSATQQLLRLNPLELAKLNTCQFDSIYDPLLLMLRSKGMVCESAPKQYQHLINSDLADKKIFSRSMSLTLMMTEGCNFSCSYCNQGLDKDPKKIDQSTVSKVLSYVSRHEDLRKLHISWYGGEPLLAFKEIVEFSTQFKGFCKAQKIYYSSSVLSNGYLLSPEKAQKLLDAGVKNAQISMDGYVDSHDSSRFPSKHTGSYNKILDNVKDVLAATSMNIVVRVNVSKRNIDGIPKLVEDISRREIPCERFSMYFALVYDPSNSQLEDAGDVGTDIISEYQEYADAELSFLRCLDSHHIKAALDIDEHMGDCLVTRHNSFAINPYGDLFKCYIPISNPTFKLGDVSDFDAAKESDTFRKWNSWTAFNDEYCKKCRLVGSCRGGCPLHFVSKPHEDMGMHCPTSKLCFNEHLFRRAINNGLVSKDDWDETLSPTKLSSLSFEYPSDCIQVPDLVSLKGVKPT
ncbi:SPASM domain-containing protein [Cyanobium sp. Alchichica 3B3-8F6]|uniref:radical SAM/SPASM domain-containing protein n=1 Tax=Cyanobium sp. Alchichica 3B3-8F6 TaxID=2823696 RepID=UPI0020CC9FB2|nr:radical SAM protein [Cyanobium sp. Alchichica 3B3-8F6]MCP9881892.1 SPASM domain-containing protein [Cyanobium sp. Alchichica 3B3-8F6]